MEAIASDVVKNTELFMKIYHDYVLPPESKLTTEFKLAYLSNKITKLPKSSELTQLTDSVKVTHLSSATALHTLFLSYIARGATKAKIFPKNAIGLKPQGDRAYYLAWLETITDGIINLVIKPIQETFILIGKNTTTITDIVLPEETTSFLKTYVDKTRYKTNNSKGLSTVKRQDKREVPASDVIKYIIQPMSSKAKQTIALLAIEAAAIPGLMTGLITEASFQGDAGDNASLYKQWNLDTARLLQEFDLFAPLVLVTLIVNEFDKERIRRR